MKKYIIEHYPPSNLHEQERLKAWQGGAWSTNQLEDYINTAHPEYDLINMRSNHGDMILTWKVRE